MYIHTVLAITGELAFARDLRGAFSELDGRAPNTGRADSRHALPCREPATSARSVSVRGRSLLVKTRLSNRHQIASPH